MVTIDEQLDGVTKAIRAARCAEGPVVFGSPCGDVQSALVQVSLSAMPPSPERERLLAIPTGLTIDRKSVDALVRAGHDATVTSEPIRQFLNDYPPRAASYPVAASGR
jgi:hypothetical protein